MIGFNEMMRGRALIQAGQGTGPSLRCASFTVAVTGTDLEPFLADLLHPASVSGLATIAGLTSARGARDATTTRHAAVASAGGSSAAQAAVSHHREIP